jgi:hypothetical protein
MRLIALRVFFVLLGLGLWVYSQALIGARELSSTGIETSSAVLSSGDTLLSLTAPINDYLNEHIEAANLLLISSSAIIDILGIFLLLSAIFGKSFRPFVGLFLIFSLRQMIQGLCALPPPENMLWHDPGFPSLLVTYGVANDFFFSGHTALAVFGASELWRLKHRAFKYLAVGIAPGVSPAR